MKANQTAVQTLPLCTVLLLGLGCWGVTAQTFSTLKIFGVEANVTGFNPVCQLVRASDGTLYGTTSTGEGSAAGAVFKVQPDGSGFSVLKYFTNAVDGANPLAGLTLSDGVLYGTTVNGGSFGMGTVFRVNTNGAGFAVLKNFEGDGANPVATLALEAGTLYGTTTNGGSSYGTVFKLSTNGSGFTVLKQFTWSDGAQPYASLLLSEGVLYGTTFAGGSMDAGTVFKLNMDGTGFMVLKELTVSDGLNPRAGLTLSGNVLYGTTSAGGNAEAGTIFKLNTDGTDFQVVYQDFFDAIDGYLSSSLTLEGNVFYGTTSSRNPSGEGSVFKVNSDGTGYSILKMLSRSEGANPQAALVLSSGVLYGTTASGGIVGQGTVFKVNTDGSDFTVLKHCAFSDALNPRAGVTHVGTLIYGTTYSGGSAGKGTIFQLNSDGTGYTVLKNFTGSDGANPQASLTVSSAVLYGTTANGGSGGGTAFRMNADGSGYTVLKQFTQPDGIRPTAGLLVSGSTLYGTTSLGGVGAGTVFRMNTNGTSYTVLKHFGGSDGGFLLGKMTMAGDWLYGTAALGGSSGNGTVFKLSTNGTSFSVLKHFAGDDGMNPSASLTVSDGVLYGTTMLGGSSGQGTAFRLNVDGSDFLVLASFSSGGIEPLSGLTISDGVLYGTTPRGGVSNLGTVFKVNTNGTGFAVIKQFSGGDGNNPQGDLSLVGDSLYGTTVSGGTWGGTVYKLARSSSLPVIQCTNLIVEWGTEWTIVPPPVADAACPNAGPPVLAGAVTNNTACPQLITLFWEYTNCLQQTASCEQNISVVDITPPVPDCPTNKTVSCGTTWGFDTPTATDNYWGTNLTIALAGPPETNSSCPMIVEQMWMIWDGCGNPAFCSQQVTVVDTNPPTLVCPTNMQVTAPPTNAVAVDWVLNASTLCANLGGVASSPPSGTSFLPDTTNTVTAWAWTECLLTNTCTFTVTISRAGANFLGFNTGQFFSVVGARDVPTVGEVLVVRFREPVAVDTFVPITSSDPSVLRSDGAWIPAGQVSAEVLVNSLTLGTVTLTAHYGVIESTATVAVVSEMPRPALSIQMLPGAVRLAWPTNAVGFLLESNNTLAAASGWGVFTSNYFILDTNYVITNFLDDPIQFFRLRRP